MRVVVSKRASRQIVSASSWWRENREKAPDLFDQELARALALLEHAPLAGRRAEGERVKDARVIVFQKTGYVLFYRVLKNDHVRVTSLRHGRRQERAAG